MGRGYYPYEYPEPRYVPPPAYEPSPEEERAYLSSTIGSVEKELEALKARLGELEEKKD